GARRKGPGPTRQQGINPCWRVGPFIGARRRVGLMRAVPGFRHGRLADTPPLPHSRADRPFPHSALPLHLTFGPLPPFSREAAVVDGERSLAIFIDFENLALGFQGRRERFDIARVLERMVEKGKIVAKKAYADWSRFSHFTHALHESAIE